MGMMKSYLLDLLHACSEDAGEQDYIEQEILPHTTLTYDLATDVRTVTEKLNPAEPQFGVHPSGCPNASKIAA
jgi:hypothetical protein